MFKIFYLKTRALYVVFFTLFSCIKAPVTFSDNSNSSDPNISYIDNTFIELATYKLDSFITSNTGYYQVGYHKDPQFGTIISNAYTEIGLPLNNPIINQAVFFDSLVLVLNPNGDYYGDTTLPFNLKVCRLQEKIEEPDDLGNYFNHRTFKYNSNALGSITQIIKPNNANQIKIKLPDSIGINILNMLKKDDLIIQDQQKFNEYFKGIVLTSDSSITSALFTFKNVVDVNAIRLHYHLSNTFFEEKTIDFPILSAKQFNNSTINFNGTALANFTPFKNQLLSSTTTNKKAYLNSVVPSYIKINFPNLQFIKELHPYVRVMKAELVIKPLLGSSRFPYKLPPVLNLYQTDQNNGLQAKLFEFDGKTVQMGNLVIDELFGKETKYTFDVTGFINRLIIEGRFSTTALALAAPSGAYGGALTRLIVNDQSAANDIQLKLFVLGL